MGWKSWAEKNGGLEPSVFFKVGGTDTVFRTVGNPLSDAAKPYLASDGTWKTRAAIPIIADKPYEAGWPAYHPTKRNRNGTDMLYEAAKKAYKNRAIPDRGYSLDAEAERQAQRQADQQAAAAAEADAEAQQRAALEKAAQKRRFAKLVPNIIARKRAEAEAAVAEAEAAAIAGTPVQSYDATREAEQAVAAYNALDEFADTVDDYIGANPGIVDPQAIQALPPAYRSFFTFVVNQLFQVED